MAKRGQNARRQDRLPSIAGQLDGSVLFETVAFRLAGGNSQALFSLGDVMLILLIVVLILVFGGGGGYYFGRGAGWRGPHYGGGLVGLLLIVLLVLWLSGTMGPGMLR